MKTYYTGADVGANEVEEISIHSVDNRFRAKAIIGMCVSDRVKERQAILACPFSYEQKSNSETA